jgi:hypothetical protein
MIYVHGIGFGLYLGALMCALAAVVFIVTGRFWKGDFIRDGAIFTAIALVCLVVGFILRTF